jgi:Skp family chaperone for outer membrane proteins
MRFRKLLLIPVAFIAFVGAANAQVPAASAQAPNLKVGVVNSDMFINPTTGITKLVAALRTLETEFKPRRDELTALATRFDTLQKQPTANVPQQQLVARQEQAQALQIEIRRKQEDARVAYGRRFSTLTDPIRLSIFSALEAYVKARGVDLLIDQAKFPDGVLLVNKNADLTAAFIKDFNAKNP